MSNRMLGLIMLSAPFVLFWLATGILFYKNGRLRTFATVSGGIALAVLWIFTASYLLSSK